MQIECCSDEMMTLTYLHLHTSHNQGEFRRQSNKRESKLASVSLRYDKSLAEK